MNFQYSKKSIFLSVFLFLMCGCQSSISSGEKKNIQDIEFDLGFSLEVHSDEGDLSVAVMHEELGRVYFISGAGTVFASETSLECHLPGVMIVEYFDFERGVVVIGGREDVLGEHDDVVLFHFAINPVSGKITVCEREDAFFPEWFYGDDVEQEPQQP